MNSFYTSVNLIGNNLLYIGYENGQRIQRKFRFSPTLHVISNKPTNWKTLDGRYAKPIQFDTVGDARDFKDKYKDVENFEVHGYDRFLYQYISQEFQGEVDYDINTESYEWNEGKINGINLTLDELLEPPNKKLAK